MFVVVRIVIKCGGESCDSDTIEFTVVLTNSMKD